MFVRAPSVDVTLLTVLVARNIFAHCPPDSLGGATQPAKPSPIWGQPVASVCAMSVANREHYVMFMYVSCLLLLLLLLVVVVCCCCCCFAVVLPLNMSKNTNPMGKEHANKLTLVKFACARARTNQQNKKRKQALTKANQS